MHMLQCAHVYALEGYSKAIVPVYDMYAHAGVDEHYSILNQPAVAVAVILFNKLLSHHLLVGHSATPPPAVSPTIKGRHITTILGMHSTVTLSFGK